MPKSTAAPPWIGSASALRYPTRNYFRWYVTSDSYNTERLEFARGPNSILFGDGNPGGISTTWTKQALFERRSSVQMRTGSNGGFRVSGDHNQPISDKLAFRVNAVYDRLKGWRDGDTPGRQGVHLAATYRISKNTQLRAEFEDGLQRRHLFSQNYQDQSSNWNGTTSYNGVTAPSTSGTGVGRINSTAANDYWVLSDLTGLMNWRGFYQSTGTNLVMRPEGRDTIANFPSLPSREFGVQPPDGYIDTFTMGSDYLVGLVSCALNDGTLNTCTFTNVSVSDNSNSAPVGVSDSYSVNEGATLNVSAAGVLANDTDADSDPLTAVKISDPINGGLTLNSDGSFTYIHDGSDTTSDSFTYQADDGVDTSATTTVSLTINPVNDAPSFTKGSNQTVMANTGAQTVPGWATTITSGEAGQTVDFIVSNDNTSLFSSQPAVSAAGTLTFTPVGYVAASDSATVSVQIHDNGGTANGGVDTSAVQTFTITIDPYLVLGAWPTDVGSPTYAGSSSESGGTVTISGGGADIYHNSDQFHFLNRSWSGDARLVARVVSQTDPETHIWAKAGLMLRDSSATGARHVLLDISPQSIVGGSIQMMTRATTNGSTSEVGRFDGYEMPYWLRLERHSNVFTGWYSLDGELWLTTGSTTLALNDPALAGLAVTAHDDTKLNTAEFDNVSFVSPPSWTATDVGSVGTTGSTSIDYANDEFTLNGAGSDIYNSADSFHFCYVTLTGDATIIAEVTSVEDTDEHAKGGLMIRQSLTNNSVHATIVLKPGDGTHPGAEFLRRTSSPGSTGHSSGSPVSSLAPPRFLKLVRSGSSFSAYESDTGASWTQVGSTESITMTGTVYVGLISCSKDTGNLCTVTFESVYVK